MAGFLAGSGAVMVLLWGPVVLTRWAPFSRDVLGYQGISVRQWGIVQFATWAGLPQTGLDVLIGPGRFVVLLASAALPVLLLRRRPAALGPAAGLSLSLFLLLSPAFSMQYLVWVVAGAYLVDQWAATAYNLLSGVLIVVVYDRWNAGAYPWRWYEAHAVNFETWPEFTFAVLSWVALAVVVGAGLRLLRAADQVQVPVPAEPPGATPVELGSKVTASS